MDIVNSAYCRILVIARNICCRILVCINFRILSHTRHCSKRMMPHTWLYWIPHTAAYSSLLKTYDAAYLVVLDSAYCRTLVNARYVCCRIFVCFEFRMPLHACFHSMVTHNYLFFQLGANFRVVNQFVNHSGSSDQQLIYQPAFSTIRPLRFIA